MKSRIWHLATVGVLCVSVSGQLLADERGEGNPAQARPNGGQQHGSQGQGGNNQPRAERNQERSPTHQDNQSRHERNQASENRGQSGSGQWNARPDAQNHGQGRPASPGKQMTIQPRPDSVQQNQRPDRRPDNNGHWQGSASRPGPGNPHPNDKRWMGRPSGHGNGWGSGPQYRPGYIVDRFPGKHWQVPYRGQNYFFSGGYWYRPQGPRYVVVRPPYGIRVGYLPDYAREVWIGSTLMFLAAGAYYAYQPATQDYIVMPPPTNLPQPAPQPVSNGYDVVAYPVNGQSPGQIDQDRYDCYRWAVDQSGFDPAQVTYAPSPAVVQTYRQAQGNCLGSRGYQINY